MDMYKDLTEEQITRQKAKQNERSKRFYSKMTEEQRQRKRESERAYYQKTKAQRRERQRAYYAEARDKDPIRYAFNCIKQGAKDRNIEFSITKEYLESIWNTHCPILGIPLFRNTGGKTASDNSPSIDRIDNTKGYIEGNIMVISYRANVIKNMGTAEEHQKIADYLMLLEAGRMGSSPA